MIVKAKFAAQHRDEGFHIEAILCGNADKPVGKIEMLWRTSLQCQIVTVYEADAGLHSFEEIMLTSGVMQIVAKIIGDDFKTPYDGTDLAERVNRFYAEQVALIDLDRLLEVTA